MAHDDAGVDRAWPEADAHEADAHEAAQAVARERMRREVVSFARRDGRHSHRHQQAWDARHARFVIDPPRQGRSTSIAPTWSLDVPAAFGRVAPVVVEIGSGDGEAVLASARAHPEVDHLAVEVYRPGLARTIVAAARGGLENVRVVPGDARALVEGALPPESVREVRVFFPDPWPKARHHKRRLVDDAFVAAVTRVLEPGGVLRLATDWQDYADAMRAACEAAPGLESRHPAKPWAPRFEGRVLTRYERKGLDSGREIRDLEFGRPARR